MPRDLIEIAPGLINELIVEDGVAHWRHHDSSIKPHLEYLAELRKNPGALDHMSFAGWELSFPSVEHLQLIKNKLPDLDSPDRETRRRAWAWFMKSSYADPYRVRERRRAVTTN